MQKSKEYSQEANQAEKTGIPPLKWFFRSLRAARRGRGPFGVANQI